MQGTNCQNRAMTSDKTSQLESVLTPDEVASALKVSSKTVMRLLREGDLKGSKLGGQWRVTVSEYNRFVSEGSQKKAAA